MRFPCSFYLYTNARNISLYDAVSVMCIFLDLELFYGYICSAKCKKLHLFNCGSYVKVNKNKK